MQTASMKNTPATSSRDMFNCPDSASEMDSQVPLSRKSFVRSSRVPSSRDSSVACASCFVLLVVAKRMDGSYFYSEWRRLRGG